MDFLLTPSGDISFEIYEKENNPFIISFITSKSKTLTVSFYTDNFKSIRTNDSSLVVNFSTYNPNNDKTITTTTSNEFYEQQVKIRLLTAIGDMKSYKTLGTNLESIKHEIIDNPEIEQKIHDEIARAIEDIIPNFELTISLKKDIYYGYSNCIVVEINDKDRNKQLIYEI